MTRPPLTPEQAARVAALLRPHLARIRAVTPATAAAPTLPAVAVS